MKKAKKVLSVVISLCILLNISVGVSVNANAATSTRNKIISSNISKMKKYIRNNGFVNGNGNYAIQNYDNSDSLDFYYLMFIDSETDELNFQLNVEDSYSEELVSVLILDATTTDTERYSLGLYYGDSDYPDISAHSFIGQNYHDELNNAAYYIDYNNSTISNRDAINWFSTLTQCAFSGWNYMLQYEMGLDLGALGYIKYCSGHYWNNGEITKKATPTATGTKTYTCTNCGTSKKKTIPKCEKYSNTLSVKGKTKTVKYATVKKKNVTVVRKDAITVSKAQGKVTYKKSSGNKNITVSSSGKITIKKGLKKGTYKIKVNVKAAGNANYKSKTKTVTVKIIVK